MKSNSTKLRNVLSLPFTRGAVAALAAIAALGAAAPARAADKPDEDWTAKVGGEHRRINRHNFITPNYVYSAMTNGSLAFAQGLGTYSVKSGGADANLFYYQQTFVGQIGILNRVSIDLYASGTAAVGGDLKTVLVLGALAGVTAGGMPKVRIFTLDRIGLQVSAGVGVFYQRSVGLSPALMLNELVDSTAAGREPDLGKGVLQFQELNIAPAVMIAEGWGPIGVQVSGSPTFAVAGDKSAVGKIGLDAGGHLAFDIHALTRYVPVALTGEYMANVAFADHTVRHNVVGGLYYSGRRDLEFGGMFGYSTMVATGSREASYFGGMVIHYFL